MYRFGADTIGFRYNLYDYFILLYNLLYTHKLFYDVQQKLHDRTSYTPNLGEFILNYEECTTNLLDGRRLRATPTELHERCNDGLVTRPPIVIV